jgi:predicted  nucleic acid-binding Zn ribbon protein
MSQSAAGMKLSRRMPDSMVLKWQLEWVAAQTIQICGSGMVMETTSLLRALELVMMEEPTAVETRLK